MLQEEENTELKEEIKENVKPSIESLEKEIENQKNKYLYLAAEFDNYKKRVVKEKNDLVHYTKENIYLELLNLIDDVERAITNTKDSNDINTLKDSNVVIYNRFKNYLDRNNIKEIISLNAEFNPNLHEAITTIDSNEETKNKVVDVIQKGYIINDKVIRHTKVVVGK